jgi:multicomponent Na+:H+ antiporter subunit G
MRVIASACMILGALLAVTSALGLQRFRDVFARMHAATKPATLGLLLMLSGAAMAVGGIGPVTKLVLVIMLQLITAPVGAHLVGRATFRTGTELDPETRFDEESERIRPGDPV